MTFCEAQDPCMKEGHDEHSQNGSGEPVMAAILGGPSLFFGPILGMFIMTFFHAWVLGFTVFWPVVMGALILIIIFFLPGGILGFAEGKLKDRRITTNKGYGNTGTKE